MQLGYTQHFHLCMFGSHKVGCSSFDMTFSRVRNLEKNQRHVTKLTFVSPCY